MRNLAPRESFRQNLIAPKKRNYITNGWKANDVLIIKTMSLERPSSIPSSNPETITPEDFARQAQAVIGDRNIEFGNFEKFADGKNRFLWGFTKAEDPSLTPGFIKMGPVSNEETSASNKEKLDDFLYREVKALETAQRMGVPSVKILQDFTITPDKKHALIHLEALDSNDGSALTSAEMIAAADPELGTWAATTLHDFAGREIPPNTETASWKRWDERNETPEVFNQTWQADAQVVLSGLKEKHRLRFAKVIEQVKQELDPVITASQTSDKEYLVHNDASPSNTFFNETTRQAILLDFERAGTTHNQSLAVLTDISTFYGRCWPNPNMQKAFIRQYLESSPPEQRAKEYIQLKGAIVFGSIFFAKFAMDRNHPEHTMAVGLLGSLEKNLAYLDKTYLDISQG